MPPVRGWGLHERWNTVALSRRKVMINHGSENGVERGWEAGFATSPLQRRCVTASFCISRVPFSRKLASLLRGLSRATYEISTES